VASVPSRSSSLNAPSLLLQMPHHQQHFAAARGSQILRCGRLLPARAQLEQAFRLAVAFHGFYHALRDFFAYAQGCMHQPVHGGSGRYRAGVRGGRER
jgi:hypothetical protein